MKLTIKFLEEVAFPTIKDDPKNKHKGLIPRFHQDICDKYYGATKESLAKACQHLAEDGILAKAFIKFSPSKSDELSEPNEMGIKTVTKGPHVNMNVSRDGRLATPIYWFANDTDIPPWATQQESRKNNFRLGQEWMEKNKENKEMPL